jgi:hypothetical protein
MGAQQFLNPKPVVLIEAIVNSNAVMQKGEKSWNTYLN